MKKNITPRNTNGQRHGYCEYYWYNSKLWYKCVYLNGKKNGFFEHYWDGKVSEKNYYL